LISAWEDSRGDFVSGDDGGGEGDEISSGTTAGELDGAAATCLSSGVTRATALLMIWMISSSVSRSSTNTLQYCQDNRWGGVRSSPASAE
jgi:hypothetical protein